MKYFIITSIFLLIFGCKKDPISPPSEEDFTFPASSKFAVTIYSPQLVLKKGDAVDIRLVFYNLQNVFGTAIELNYPNDLIEFEDDSKMLLGKYFTIGDSTLILKRVEQPHGRASAAISYIKGYSKLSSGSGIVFKLKGKALNAGNAQIEINKNKLQIINKDGLLINNFSNLLIENIILNIRL